MIEQILSYKTLFFDIVTIIGYALSPAMNKEPARRSRKNVLHGLQTGMGSGVVVLQEKGCLLLWPDSGNSSFQLSQRRDVAVRVDGLSGFKEFQKDHPFPIPEEVHITLPVEGSGLNFFFDGEFTCRHFMDYRFDSGS